MDRIISLQRIALISPFAGFLRRLRIRANSFADDTALDTIPSERLADMGIAPRTEQNRRHSGEPGSIPRADLS